MKIQTSITLMLGLVATFFIASFFISQHYEVEKMNIFFRDRASDKQKDLDNLVELHSATNEQFANDYSLWDDMVAFVSSRDKDWAYQNIETALPIHKSDAAWVLRPDLSLVYSVNLLHDDALKPLPVPREALRTLFSNNAFGHFFADTPAGLVEINTAPIQPTNDNDRTSPPKGYLLIGRRWSPGYLNSIAGMLDCDIRMVSPGETAYTYIDDAPVSFSKALPGWDGKDVMTLEVRSTPVVVKEFGRSTRNQAVLFIAFAGVIMLFLFYAIGTWVWVPLAAISASLDRQDAGLLSPVKDEDNEMGRIAGLIRSFFAQKEALTREVAVRAKTEESLRILEKAMMTSQLGITITDTAGRIIYTNPAEARMHGYSVEELLGREAGKMFAPEDMRSPLTPELMNAVTSLRRTSVNVGRDGRAFVVKLISDVVRNRDGEPVALITISEDITKQDRAEKELDRLRPIAEAANMMKNTGYIFAGIRHELGNPVNSAKASLTVLKAKLDTFPRETVSEYIDNTLAAVSQVEYVLKSLKSFSMYENVEIKPLQAAAFVENFLALIKDDFAAKGITVKAELRPDVSLVMADSRALQQVMLNVFVNAADALAGVEAPAVALTVARDQGFVTFEVADNGCGMTAGQQKELFKPFYTFKPDGTGLGLVITRNMLVKMGGDISITSAPGAGTVVRISLPEGDDA